MQQSLSLGFMEFKVFTLLLILLIFMPNPIFGFKDCNFPAIFNFGDSNSDTGGLTAMFGQGKLPPPYGMTFFRAPSARFSDGRVIVDFIAESLGLPYLSAFLDSMGTNFSHGANFATGGSPILPAKKTYQQSGFSPISLDFQQVQYSDLLTRSYVVRKREFFQSLLPTEDYFSRGLYTFDIGQNDLTAGFDSNMTTDEIKAIIPDLLGQYSNVIKLVYEQGGRSFWIHNTGPLGCLTYFVDRFLNTEKQFDKYGCYIPYNNVSQYFNLKLKEMVLQLRKELPKAAITYVDIYSVKYTLFTQAHKLGFENPLLVCCGFGGKFNFHQNICCGREYVVNSNEVDHGKIRIKSCKDPSVRINWDGVHFTEAANKWVFHQIINGSFSDPPIPLKLACNKMKNLDDDSFSDSLLSSVHVI